MLPRHFSLSLFRHVIARRTNQWAGFNCAISPALFFVTWSPNALLLVLPRTTKCLVTYLICRTHGCADSEDKSESVYVAILCLAQRRHQFIIYVAHNIDNYTCLRALNMHLVQLPHRRDLLQQQQPLLLLLLLLHQLRHLLLLPQLLLLTLVYVVVLLLVTLIFDNRYNPTTTIKPLTTQYNQWLQLLPAPVTAPETRLFKWK